MFAFTLMVLCCSERPKVIGPDVSWVHDQPGDKEGTAVPNHWLKGFLQHFTPDAVTFHHYPAGKLALPPSGEPHNDDDRRRWW